VKNVKIGVKMTASFLIIVALTTFMGIYMAVSLKNINESDALVYEKAVVPLGMLVQTADLAQEIRVQAFYWKISKSDEGRDAALRTMEKSYAALKELSEKQKDRVIVDAGKKPLDDLIAAANKYVLEMRNFAIATTDRCPLSGLTTVDFPPSLGGCWG